ncbi:MAG: SDR family oxidoreductase [Phycisphaerae bacterium]
MITIDLTGKTAVITGATGELGRVMTRTLARAGANVAICYLKAADKAAALQQEVAKLGGKCMTVQADITDEKSVPALRDAVAAKLGPADIIVNNAVIQYEWKHVLQQSVADYESQFRSCVLHNVLMAQAFVPAMIQKKWGRVIAINTECAMQNQPNQSAYVSGKRGMDGVLRCLAREVGGHGITVNQVAPGWTISDKYRGTDQERQPEYEKNVALKRRGYDQDIANAVAFLASNMAEFITGAYLPVCGGNVMPCI